MDLSILLTAQSAPPTTRTGNERRTSRSYSESNDRYALTTFISPHACCSFDAIYHGRLASMGIIPSRLEPFRGTDIAGGIYADGSDALGRVWYHIPNLGPKFCDAVRKYSIVANYREAHVIARKKSKDSECMWIGIVGDPASYTTGSKRHIIDLMLRNPGQTFDQSARRQQGRVRSTRTSLSGKRRKRRRRRFPFNNESRNESEESTADVTHIDEADEKPDEVVNGNETDADSSQLSSTPSSLSLENQVPNMYGFSLRERNHSPPTSIPLQVQGAMLAARSRFALPTPTNLAVQTENHDRDWHFTPLYDDPAMYAFREPPLPSPEPGKSIQFTMVTSSTRVMSSNNTSSQKQVLSPLVSTVLHKRYSVADLNELLVISDSHA